jgi:hypothetical protein
MKGAIQIEIRAFAFSNPPILQYSSTPQQLAIFTGKAIDSDLPPRTRFAILNRGPRIILFVLALT